MRGHLTSGVAGPGGVHRHHARRRRCVRISNVARQTRRATAVALAGWFQALEHDEFAFFQRLERLTASGITTVRDPPGTLTAPPVEGDKRFGDGAPVVGSADPTRIVREFFPGLFATSWRAPPVPQGAGSTADFAHPQEARFRLAFRAADARKWRLAGQTGLRRP